MYPTIQAPQVPSWGNPMNSNMGWLSQMMNGYSRPTEQQQQPQPMPQPQIGQAPNFLSALLGPFAQQQPTSAVQNPLSWGAPQPNNGGAYNFLAMLSPLFAQLYGQGGLMRGSNGLPYTPQPHPTTTPTTSYPTHSRGTGNPDDGDSGYYGHGFGGRYQMFM